MPLLADDRAAAAAAASARAPAPTGVALPRAVPTPVHSGRRRPDSPPRASFRLPYGQRAGARARADEPLDA